MKKLNLLYSIGYAIFGAMLTYGSLEITIIGMNFFGNESDHPVFIPLCFGLILLSVAALLILFAGNARSLKSVGNKRRTVLLELLITIPLFTISLFGTAILVDALRGIL